MDEDEVRVQVNCPGLAKAFAKGSPASRRFPPTFLPISGHFKIIRHLHSLGEAPPPRNQLIRHGVCQSALAAGQVVCLKRVGGQII
jgi:hypothetical protein